MFVCAKNSREDWSRRVLVSSDAEITIYKKTPSSFMVDDPGPCIVPLIPEIDNIKTIQADIVDCEYKTTIKKILIQK